jgi:hypothetical protein
VPQREDGAIITTPQEERVLKFVLDRFDEEAEREAEAISRAFHKISNRRKQMGLTSRKGVNNVFGGCGEGRDEGQGHETIPRPRRASRSFFWGVRRKRRPACVAVCSSHYFHGGNDARFHGR